MTFNISSNAILVLFLASFSTVACSNREVAITKHEAPIVAVEQGEIVGDEVSQATAGAPVDMAALRAINPNSLRAKAAELKLNGVATSTASEKVAALSSLATFVLNRNYLDDPRILHTPEMRSALTAFNTMLVLLAKQNAEEAAPWIEKARIAIESGCDGEMKNCTNLSFFRDDGQSSEIMQLAAQSLNSKIDAAPVRSKERDGLVRLYYRRMGVAFDLRNQIDNDAFKFAYLDRASDYADTFSRSASTSRERRLLTRHSEVFEMILNRFNPEVTKSAFAARFETFVNAFSPWNYSRRIENPFGSAATRMLSLAAKNFLYESGTGTLSKSLIKSIERSQAQSVPEAGQPANDPLDDLDDSFEAIAGALKKQEPKIWQNLGLSDSMGRDEYFFIVDRIYGDHLTPDDASEIWRGSHRDSKALLKVAEQYVKIQIAGQIVRTNRYMSSIYSNKEWSSATLFKKAVEKSYPISSQWNEMLSRIDRLKLFLDRNLKTVNADYGTAEFKNMSDMLLGVRRNIKYLSVYPNMMLMAYFMAEEKTELEVSSPWGVVKFDSATIIGWFFDGRMPPLFNFGNDPDPLKRIETLYAFLFALKTETFSTFSVPGKQPIDIPRFFEVVVTKFLDQDRIDLEKSLTDMRKEMRSDNAMDTFLAFCRQDEILLRQNIKPGTAGATFLLEFIRLPSEVYMGGSDSNGKSAIAFYSDARVKQVRNLNEALRRKLDFVSIMMNLIDKHNEKSDVKDSVRAQIREKVQTYIGPILKLQSEYLSEVTYWDKTLSKCVDQSVAIEIDRQNDLIELEREHLRAAWLVINDIRKKGSDSSVNTAITAANAELKKSLDLDGVVSATPYTPISQITSSGYIYAEMDVILRVRANLKKIAPKVFVQMPSDLADTSLWRDRKQVAIPFQEPAAETKEAELVSQEAFIRQGLTNFNESFSAYVRWLTNTSDATPFANRLELKVELYKIGKIKTFNTQSPSCQGGAITSCPLQDYEMTAPMIVADTAKIISMLSLTENGGQPKRDTKILKWLNVTSRWTKEKLMTKKFMLDTNGDPISLFEYVYMTLVEDRSALDEARAFNLTELSVGRFLFSPEQEFKSILSRGFPPLVNNYFDRAKALETAINEREKSDAQRNSILEYSYELRQGQVLKTAIEMNRGIPVYLDRRKSEETETRHTLFDLETGNAFVTSGK